MTAHDFMWTFEQSMQITMIIFGFLGVLFVLSSVVFVAYCTVKTLKDILKDSDNG
jgi:hypothetical protein